MKTTTTTEQSNKKVADEKEPVGQAAGGGDGGEKEDDEAVAAPYGADFMSAIHRSLSDLSANMKAGMGPLERAEVKDFVAAKMEQYTNDLVEMEGLHDQLYSEVVESLCPHGKCDDGEVDGEMEKSARFKSWLKSNSSNRFTIRGYAARANRIAAKADGESLTKSERQMMRDLAEHLITLQEQAEKAPETEILKAIGELKKGHEELTELAKSVLPHNRK